MGNLQTSNDVKFGQYIGHGSFGEVYTGTWKGQKVALKKLASHFFQDGLYDRGPVFDNLRREWEILSELSHPNVVKYFEVILNPRAPPIIVLELCDCDLFHFIQTHRESHLKVSFQDVVNIMGDVAGGLKYLHSRSPPILHRDLSSKNILLNGEHRAKITDMGVSKAFPEGAMYATVGVCTPVYAAPETYPERLQPSGRFAQKAYYTEKIDIFSFGAMLLEVIIGRQPRKPLPDPLLEDGEVVPEYIRRSEDLDEMGPNHPLYSLVSDCLNNQPQDRPTAQELIDILVVFKVDHVKGQRRKSIARSTSRSSLNYSESPPTMSDSSIVRLKRDRFDYFFKIVIVGDSGVGKSSIIQRFVHPETPLWPENGRSTLQPADFFQRIHCLGKTIHLHIVDTPGERRSGFHQVHDNVVPLIYRRLNGAVVVFDVGDLRSYTNITPWIDTLRKHIDHDTPIVLVGNKTDLKLQLWKISSSRVESFASEQGLFYIETSATGFINIDEIFSILIARMIQQGGKDDMESADGVFYQSPMNSLLKGNKPPPYSVLPITDRSSTQQLSSGNIQLTSSNLNRKKTCPC